jgi:glycosyltransferase involved in cell wall biosynthesis
MTFVYQDGELLEELRRCAGELGVGEATTFRGAVPRAELDAWYSAADSFVLGSHREGSGYALIEAMACGCPPVVTAIPSFRAIAGETLAGSFWPPGDARAFARALVTAGRGSDMRAAVLERFRRALSPEALGQAALRAYRLAAGIRSGPRPG